jgi:DNA-binding transcriptional ArsR family regulator
VNSNGKANGKELPDQIAEVIKGELRNVDRELERYTALLDRKKRLEAALKALQPSTVSKIEDRPSPKWTPTLESQERTLRFLIEQGQPTTATGLSSAVGGQMSHDTIRRSLKALRDSGRIRVAGSGRGGGILYAPMPEETR